MSNETQNVYVVTYEHKHGLDVGVYSTEEKAIEAAWDLAHNRVIEEDRWEKEQQEEFAAMEDLGEAIAFFNDVEQEWNYSEFIEILERPLE